MKRDGDDKRIFEEVVIEGAEELGPKERRKFFPFQQTQLAHGNPSVRRQFEVRKLTCRPDLEQAANGPCTPYVQKRRRPGRLVSRRNRRLAVEGLPFIEVDSRRGFGPAPLAYSLLSFWKKSRPFSAAVGPLSTSSNTNFFAFGFRRMVPIMTGVVPFGAVMGAAAAEAKMALGQSVWMNLIVFAGAAQLAALDLMTKNATIIVIVATGLIINLRFILYSAAIAPVLAKEGFWTKLVSAYFLTDQSYAVMNAHESYFKTSRDPVQFYFGACVCMALTWHLSVLAGYLFGNFAPRAWALDYAVPLSFIVLIVPTLKSRAYVMVAVCSALAALVLHDLPFNLGLIVSAAIAIGLAAILMRKRGAA